MSTPQTVPQTGPQTIAILGAWSLVGHEILRLLDLQPFPVREVRLLTTSHGGRRRLTIGGHTLELHEANARTLDGVTLAIFLGDPDDAVELAGRLVKAKAVVIDATSAHRANAAVPLVVPEVNLGVLSNGSRLISLPSPLASQIATALQPLKQAAGIRRFTATTYHAVSDGGPVSIRELNDQVKQVLRGGSVVPHAFPHQLAFNVLPEVDNFLDNGYTREEWTIALEIRRLLNKEDLPVSITATQVPVYVGNAASVQVELEEYMDAGTARTTLINGGLHVLDDPSVSLYPQPWTMAGKDGVHVGRVRMDTSARNGLLLWVVADSVRLISTYIIQLARLLVG